MHGAVPLPASRSGREQRWRQTTAGCFSPHPRKESDVGQDQVVSVPAISIRAPERGAASGASSKAVTVSPFQPTPLRQERQIGRYSDRYDAISTHAPCEGSGTSKTCFLPAKSNFNPRPHVGNDILVLEIDIGLPIISIHTPCTGSGGGRCGSTDGAGEERRLTADYPIRTQVTPAGRADPSTLTV